MLEVEAFYDAETFYDVKHGQHYIINRILTALPLDIKTLGLYISWGVLLKWVIYIALLALQQYQLIVIVRLRFSVYYLTKYFNKPNIFSVDPFVSNFAIQIILSGAGAP